ncbi:MAG: hypothetical protein HY393_00750 [Candidatus Diapherotrites archaeon]|nr:hypothetical protein [Candidatus Diapherotrites archaeon]
MKPRPWIFLLFFWAILALHVNVQSDDAQSAAQLAKEEANTVVVEYHGASQLSAETLSYTLSPLDWGKSINDDFDLDLDDIDERSLTIRYLNHTYQITAERGPLGGQQVLFNVLKDGTPCTPKPANIPSLPNDGQVIKDFESACGIQFYAEWESLALETDIEIHNIAFTKKEIDMNIKDLAQTLLENNAVSIVKKIKAANEKFRVLDLQNPLDFTPAEVEDDAQFHVEPMYFDEEDSTGKTRSLVITKNGIVQYLLFLKQSTVLSSESFAVYKATQPVLISSIENYTDLLPPTSTVEWNPLSEEDLPTWEDIQSVAVPAGEATATTVASGDILLAGSRIAYVRKANRYKALIKTGISLGKKLKVITTGAKPVGAGLGLTPVGWGILIGTSAVDAGLLVYDHTHTTTVSYDQGNVILNFDEELFGEAEEQVNFIVVGKGVPLEEDTEVSESRYKGDYYLRFGSTDFENLKKILNMTSEEDLKVYQKTAELLQVKGNGESENIEKEAGMLEGQPYIKFKNMETGAYTFKYSFESGVRSVSRTIKEEDLTNPVEVSP